MAYCTMCSKRGLFLKLDKNGRCEECSARIAVMEKKRAEEIRVESERRKAEELRLEQERQRQRAIEAEKDRQAEQARLAEEARKRAAAAAQAVRDATKAEQIKTAQDLRQTKVSTYEYKAEGVYVPDDCMESFNAVPGGRRLAIVPEPTNPYDELAISLCYNGRKVGYMYRGKIRDMVRDFLDPERDGAIVITKSEKRDAPAVDVVFYEDRERLIKRLWRRKNTEVFDLLDYKGEDAQSGLSSCLVGDRVGIETVAERKARVYTRLGYTIGRLPAAMYDFVGDREIAEARIAEYGFDASGKYAATIMLVMAE